jgi:hypothetical protein
MPCLNIAPTGFGEQSSEIGDVDAKKQDGRCRNRKWMHDAMWAKEIKLELGAPP